MIAAGSNAEIAEIADLVAAYGLAADPTTVAALAARTGPLVLVNHFALREHADYGDAEDEPCGGIDAMLRYAAVSGDRLAAVGGRFLHQGFVAGPLWGDEAAWDLVVIAEYPSGRALIELLQDADYRNAFRHRRAAVARQRVVASMPFS